MSWANKALSALKKEGYTVVVKVPVRMSYEWSFYNSDTLCKTNLRNEENIPDSPGSLIEYDRRKPVIVQAELSDILEKFPANVQVDGKHLNSGGEFQIYSDMTFSLVFPRATREAVKTLLDAGYKLRNKSVTAHS